MTQADREPFDPEFLYVDAKEWVAHHPFLAHFSEESSDTFESKHVAFATGFFIAELHYGGPSPAMTREDPSDPDALYGDWEEWVPRHDLLAHVSKDLCGGWFASKHEAFTVGLFLAELKYVGRRQQRARRDPGDPY